MLQLFADLFVKEFAEIKALEVKCSRIFIPGTLAPQPLAVEIYAKVGTFGCHLLEHGLSSASAKCGWIHGTLEERRMSVLYSDLAAWLRELIERIEDDLHAELFLHLSPKEAEWYAQPDKDWHPAINRFGKLRHDIEECSKCFALGRYAAAVFHVLLVAEFGVIKVSELFGVAGDRPGWGALDRLKRINEKKWPDKSALEQKHSEFLNNLLPLAFSIKDSWRHKISHVDNKLDWIDTDFSPQVASEIISATRGFMRRLAHELPK